MTEENNPLVSQMRKNMEVACNQIQVILR